MRNKVNRLLLSLLFLAGYFAAHSQLAINEISQGTSGSKEFAEFIVIGTKTCSDSCADLRGWIFDDNNGFHGGTGVAGGCARFANIAQWQCIPYGSLILIYNPADKNTNITLPDDETDANHDGVYILPITSNKFDGNANTPANGGSISTYAGATFTNGTANWGDVAMANTTGDVFQTVSPSDLTASYFSVGWSGATGATIFFSGSATAKSYYMNNTVSNDIFSQSNWASGSAGSAQETPGVPNSVANATWINSLRNATPTGGKRDTVNVSICNGQTYFAGGANQSTQGFYSDVYTLTNGCDSTIVTNLHILNSTTQTVPVSGCVKVTVNGKDFFSNTTFKDTLFFQAGCDSVYRTYNITVGTVFGSMQQVCINTGQTYFVGGANQSTSGLYNDTLTASNGCDSVIATDLHVVTIVVDPVHLQDCRQVSYNNQSYTTSTSFQDTIKSALGCDSLIIDVHITIDPTANAVTSNKAVCINTGQQYFAGGANQTQSGIYTDTLVGSAGCDSIVITDLQVINTSTNSTTTDSCKQVTYKGLVYTNDITLTDTLFSARGCDSIYNQVAIHILPSPQVQILPRDTTINQGDSLTLNAMGNFASIYWASSGSLNDSITNSILIKPATNTYYQVTVTGDNGCTGFDSTTVNVILPPLKYMIPSGFTPNGDGHNDLFAPVFDGNATIQSMHIYNRWGELIFEAENGTRGWDGTYKGAAQPVGVYVYYIVIKDLDENRLIKDKGSITLLR